MEGEARILEQRVEPLPFARGRDEPGEGVRRKEQKRIEADPDRCLGGKRGGERRLFERPFEQRDRRTRCREDRHPQQHRAFMIAPCPREFVEPGLGRMAVPGDQLDRHVRSQKKDDQQEEGQRRQHALRHRNRTDAGEHLPTLLRHGDPAQRKLEDGKRRRDPQHRQPGLCNHCESVSVRCLPRCSSGGL